MDSGEGLPGRWLDLRIIPSNAAAGFGPALGWLAGGVASGAPVWAWPRLGSLLLGILLAAGAWGRLWTLLGEDAAPLRSSASRGQASPHLLPLPYTAAGSLSARCGAALSRGWTRFCSMARLQGDRWLETGGLVVALLLAAFLWGGTAPVVAGIGLALLALRRLVRGRPLALALLRAVGGLAWPWWFGHAVWAPLTAASLLLSVLWGMAYAGWSELVPMAPAGSRNRPHAPPLKTSRWALWWTDCAQAAVLLYFLLAGRPVVGAVCGLLLLGQVLLQTGLVRNCRWGEVAQRTWPQAALGTLLSALVLGGVI